MPHLPLSPTDEEILAFVEAWIDDLAREDYDAAYERTAHDQYYGWTPDLLRAVIEGYGLPEPHPSGTVFRVTPRNMAQGNYRRCTIDRSEVAATVTANVQYDLPLNGEWSDLTATFRIEQSTTGCIVVLEEIHVF